jgi:hypothetical protein
MARRVNLYTVDHHDPVLTKGTGFVRTVQVGKGDTLLGDPTFADMIVQYAVWRGGDPVWCKDKPVKNIYNYLAAEDIIGFQGYRKHLDFRFGRQVSGNWYDVDPIEFRQYQNWQEDHAGPNIETLLKDCDILTNPPYDVMHNGGMRKDFYQSASETDWYLMEHILRKHGITDFDLPTVTSYCVFTGTGKVFDEWMKFWWEVVCELTATLPVTCPDPGPRPDIYLPRRMAFLSERIYSLWLHRSGLRTKALPLIVCWELQ